MILYYTATQKTKIFAEALGEVTGLPVYRLESKLERKNKFLFMIQTLFLIGAGKLYPVENIPNKIEAGEIYLCSPIWGGRMAGPARYFLNSAVMKGKKVNLLITSAGDGEGYRKKAEEDIKLAGCVPGGIYSFVAVKNPEKDVIAEQLKEMLPDA